MEIGKKLKKARIACGLTQEQVATGTAVMVTVLARRRKNEKNENSQIS